MTKLRLRKIKLWIQSFRSGKHPDQDSNLDQSGSRVSHLNHNATLIWSCRDRKPVGMEGA